MAEDTLIWGRFLSPLFVLVTQESREKGRGETSPGPKLVLHTLFNLCVRLRHKHGIIPPKNRAKWRQIMLIL